VAAVLSRIKGKSRSWVGQQGFTLVEILVASMLLLIAMAGVVPLFLSGLSQSSAVRYKSAATNIARERMEEIRQLDVRAITSASDLAALFGTSETQRDIAFNVSYGVEESTYENGLLKKVTVTVDWDGPPRGSGASLTTMIHQQFVGPRVSRLDMSEYTDDPLGTPFPCLYPNRDTTLICYVAEADWGLVLDHLNEPGMTPRDVYARLTLVDSTGQSQALGDADDGYRIVDLNYTTDSDGHVTSVFFEYAFNSGDFPDGYWEFRAVVYNEYDEPGNVWRLRTRIENGPPAAATDAVAVPQTDNESIYLYWSGGPERDRAYYVLQRRIWEGSAWSSDWVTVAPTLDPNATSYKDEGEAAALLDPWGDYVTQNFYQYRIIPVDICQPGNPGPETVLEAALPDPTTTTTLAVVTTTSSSTTTTTAGPSTVYIDNKSAKQYTLKIAGDNGEVINTYVQKRTVKPIENLPAGNYLITATAAGRPTLTQSFSVPAQKDQTVLTIF
jgi:prepilin-type N-terminal cleavage/methylation domain-containing protein